MISQYFDLDPYEVCIGALVIPVLIWLITGYTYLVNRRRPADDPRKRDYDPRAILIAPFTLPFLLAIIALLFVLRALLFGIFIVFFSLLLLVAGRGSFILRWSRTFATWIGDPLLKANTYLIRLAFRPFARPAQAA